MKLLRNVRLGFLQVLLSRYFPYFLLVFPKRSFKGTVKTLIIGGLIMPTAGDGPNTEQGYLSGQQVIRC